MPGPRRDGSDHVGVVLDRQTVVFPQHPWGACDPSHGPQLFATLLFKPRGQPGLSQMPLWYRHWSWSWNGNRYQYWVIKR